MRISVQVRHGQRPRIVRELESRTLVEGAIPIAELNPDERKACRDGQVLAVVSVEVAHRDRLGAGRPRFRHHAVLHERSIAVSEIDPDGIVAAEEEVGARVAVHVGGSDAIE